MKRLLIILILLLLPVSGWGSIFYVTPTGSKTTGASTPGDYTNANCYVNIATAVAQTSGSGDVVEISTGTYTQTSQINFINKPGRILQTSSVAGQTGPVTIIADGNIHGIYLDADSDDVTISGAVGRELTIRSDRSDSGAYYNLYINRPEGVTVSHVISEDPQKYNVYLSGAGLGVTFDRCIIRGLGLGIGTTYAVVYCASGSAGTVTFNSCLFDRSTVSAGYGGYIYTTGTGTLGITLNNCIYSGFRSSAVFVANANSTVTLKNTIISGGGIKNTGDIDVLSIASGTINAYNCVINALGSDPIHNTWDISNGGGSGENCQFGVDPRVMSNLPGEGIFIMVVDDESYDSAAVVHGVMSARNLHFTWAPDGYDMTNVADWQTKVQAIAGYGHDVASHSWSHTYPDSEKAFKLHYHGAETGSKVTISVDDSTGGTVTLAHDSGTDVSWNFDATDTIHEFVSENSDDVCIGESDCGKDWRLSYVIDGEPSDSQRTTADLMMTSVTAYTDEAVNGTTGVDIALRGTTYNTGWLKDDITDWKSQLETAIQAAGGDLSGYSVTSFVVPNTREGANYYTAISASGHTIARGRLYNSASSDLGNLSIFNLPTLVQGDYFTSDTETDNDSQANIEARAVALGAMLMSGGGIAAQCSHLVGAGQNVTATELGWFIDKLLSMGVKVMSLKEAAAYIRTSPWSTADSGITWTRTWTDASNYRLQATSPCINAGTNPFSDGAGDQYDYAGNLIWSDTTDGTIGAWSDGVEIGPYGWFGGILLQ